MGTLGQLVMRMTADDSPIKRSIRSVRGDLTKLDAQKVEPKVRLDDRTAKVQVKALQSNLDQLQRKQVKLSISMPRIDADIERTKSKLEELRKKKIAVPAGVDSKELDKDLKKAEAALARLEKKRINVPVDLEGVQAEIRATEAQLVGLEKKRIRIPVVADLDAKSVQQVSGQLAKALKFPAIAASAAPVIGSLAAVTSGLFSVGAAAAPAFASVAAGGGALAALGQGLGVAKLALSGVEDAFKAVNAIQTANAAGYEATDKQIQKMAETFGLSGVAAQGFVRQLLRSSDAVDKVKKATQDEMFPALTSSLRELTDKLLPTFAKGAQGTAIALGVLAEEGTAMVTSGPFRRDFATVMEANTRTIDVFGNAGLDAADILRNLLVTVQPLTARFADFTARVAASGAAFVQAQRDSGGLDRFFRVAGDSAAQLGRIVANLGVALFQTGRAGYDAGQSLLDSFEQATKKLRDFTASVGGQNALRDYFANAAEVTREFGRLTNGAALALAKMGGDKTLAPLIAQVRGQLLPALERLMSSLGTSFGPQAINLLTTLAGTFERLSNGGGALTAFVGTLDRMARALNAILDSPIGPVVSQVLTLAGTAAAVGLVAGSLGRVAAAFAIVGKGATSVLVPIGKFLVFNTTLRAVMGGFGRVLLSVGKVLGGVLVRALGLVTVAARALFTVMLTNPIGIVITALVALGAGLIYAYRHSETFRNIVNKAFTAIRDVAASAFTAVRGFVVGAFTGIMEFLRPWFRFAQGLFELYTGVYLLIWKTAFKGISKVVETAMKVIRVVIGTAFNFVRAYLTTYMRIIRFVVSTGMKVLTTLWNAAWSAIARYLGPVFRAIRDAVTTGFNAIRGVVRAVGGGISAAWSTTWDAVTGRVSKAMDRIRSIIGGARKLIGQAWSSVVDVVQAPLRALFRFINDHLINNMNKVTAKFTDKLQIAPLPVNFRDGGWVRGPGGPRDDKVRANLSNNEFVVNAAAAKRNGPLLEAINRGGFGGAGDKIAETYEAVARRILSPLIGKVRGAAAGKGILPEMGAEGAVKLIKLIIGKSQAADLGASAAAGAITGAIGAMGRPLPAGAYRVGVPFHGYAGHTGQDLPTPIGTPVFAPFSGALSSYSLGNRSYGNYVKIHAGDVDFIGAHLSRFVKRAGFVTRGELIAYTGSTGNSSGPHLHAEIRRNGRAVDPRGILTFDKGGLLMPGQVGQNLSGKPERVLTGRDTEILQGILDAVRGRGGKTSGAGLTIVNNNTVATRRDALAVVDGTENLALRYGWG